jgi:hypothetical protein
LVTLELPGTMTSGSSIDILFSFELNSPRVDIGSRTSDALSMTWFLLIKGSNVNFSVTGYYVFVTN